MRRDGFDIAIKVLTFIFVIMLAMSIMIIGKASAHPVSKQLKNAYYPFTVEISIRDR